MFYEGAPQKDGTDLYAIDNMWMYLLPETCQYLIQ